LPRAVEGTTSGKRLQDGHHERADCGDRVGELLERPGHVRLAQVHSPLDLLDFNERERRRVFVISRKTIAWSFSATLVSGL